MASGNAVRVNPWRLTNRGLEWTVNLVAPYRERINNRPLADLDEDVVDLERNTFSYSDPETVALASTLKQWVDDVRDAAAGDHLLWSEAAIHGCGSYYDGTRVSESPDEYDMYLCVNNPGVTVGRERQGGGWCVWVRGEALEACRGSGALGLGQEMSILKIEENGRGEINPGGFYILWRDCLVNKLATVPLPEGLTHDGLFSPHYSGVAIKDPTVTPRLIWHDTIPLTMDLTPAFPVPWEALDHETKVSINSLLEKAGLPTSPAFPAHLIPKQLQWTLSTSALESRALFAMGPDSSPVKLIRGIKLLVRRYLHWKIPPSEIEEARDALLDMAGAVAEDAAEAPTDTEAASCAAVKGGSLWPSGETSDSEAVDGIGRSRTQSSCVAVSNDTEEAIGEVPGQEASEVWETTPMTEAELALVKTGKEMVVYNRGDGDLTTVKAASGAVSQQQDDEVVGGWINMDGVTDSVRLSLETGRLHLPEVLEGEERIEPSTWMYQNRSALVVATTHRLHSEKVAGSSHTCSLCEDLRRQLLDLTESPTRLQPAVREVLGISAASYVDLNSASIKNLVLGELLSGRLAVHPAPVASGASPPGLDEQGRSGTSVATHLRKLLHHLERGGRGKAVERALLHGERESEVIPPRSARTLRPGIAESRKAVVLERRPIWEWTPEPVIKSHTELCRQLCGVRKDS